MELINRSLELLSTLTKRRNLVDILLNGNGYLRQADLFEDKKAELETNLNDLFSLIREGKALYQRWVRKTEEKERQLSVPSKPLKKFIELYILDLIKTKNVHKKCHGGERGWSVKESLESHLPCSSVLSFDLENAFENVSFLRVYTLFYEYLNSLIDKKRENVAYFLSMLCTVDYSNKKGLPQGSPCSMALFNRILYPLDEVLSKKSEERGFQYSRWVDDMNISSSNRQEIEYFLGAVELTESYFPISKDKVFFQEEEIYLLGHKIKGNNIFKNTKEERLKNKCSALKFNEWFERECDKNYKSWID